MAISSVRIIRVDPYHKQYGLLVPMVAQRLLESLQALGDEADIVGPQFLARLWAKDPGVLLLAAVDQTGQIKGFAAAMFNPHTREFLLMQPRMDIPTENYSVGEMMQFVEDWARSLQVTTLTLVAKRIDQKWQKKYGFEVVRYILQKELE